MGALTFHNWLIDLTLNVKPNLMLVDSYAKATRIPTEINLYVT